MYGSGLPFHSPNGAFQNDTSSTPLHFLLYHEQSMIWLLFYLLIISIYDLRTRHIPNWVTYPLILAGFMGHFPGDMDLWFACFLLALVWFRGWMGAGDVKLWMAVLWSLPESDFPLMTLLILLSFLFTGGVQVVWRLIQKKPITGIKSPAAWRTIPFLLAFWYVH